MTLSRTGATLALLAISMQVLVCALGGRLCFRNAPIPTTRDCESACCESDAPADLPLDPIGLALADDPFMPFDSDCCIEPVLEFLGQPTVTLNLQLPAVGVPAFMLDESIRPPQAIASPGRSPAIERGLAPPSLPVVRTTILLL